MSKVLQQSLSALRGPEWDSSDEEGETQATTAVVSTNKTDAKKTKNKASASKSSNSSKGKNHNNKDIVAATEENDLALYIGHLPKEMEERDLRQFLSQFGNVQNCRVARKISSGQAKGYAFVRFEDVEVAKVAQETLHGYFLGVGNTQRLVCQLRPAHGNMFFSTDVAIRKHREQVRTEREQREIKLSNPHKVKAMTASLIKHDARKRAKLAAMGIDYDFPGYGPAPAIEDKSQAASTTTPKSKTRKETADANEHVDGTTSDGKVVERKRKSSTGSQGSASGQKKKSRKSQDKNRRKSAP